MQAAQSGGAPHQAEGGVHQPGQQSEEDAGRVDSPGMRVEDVHHHAAAQQAEQDGQHLDQVQLLLEDEPAQQGGEGHRQVGQDGGDGSAVVGDREGPGGVIECQREPKGGQEGGVRAQPAQKGRLEEQKEDQQQDGNDGFAPEGQHQGGHEEFEAEEVDDEGGERLDEGAGKGGQVALVGGGLVRCCVHGCACPLWLVCWRVVIPRRGLGQMPNCTTDRCGLE